MKALFPRQHFRAHVACGSGAVSGVSTACTLLCLSLLAAEKDLSQFSRNDNDNHHTPPPHNLAKTPHPRKVAITSKRETSHRHRHHGPPEHSRQHLGQSRHPRQRPTGGTLRVDAFRRATRQTPTKLLKHLAASINSVSRRSTPHPHAAILGRIASVRPARPADGVATVHHRRSAPAAHPVQTRQSELVPLDKPSDLRTSCRPVERKTRERRLSTPGLSLLRSAAAVRGIQRMASHGIEGDSGARVGVCLLYRLLLGKQRANTFVVPIMEAQATRARTEPWEGMQAPGRMLGKISKTLRHGKTRRKRSTVLAGADGWQFDADEWRQRQVQTIAASRTNAIFQKNWFCSNSKSISSRWCRWLKSAWKTLRKTAVTETDKRIRVFKIYTHSSAP